jgi:hypothetical protein
MARMTGRMQAVRSALLVLTLGATAASAQPAAQSQPAAQPAPPAAEDDLKAWSFGASVYGYSLPEESEYLQPTVTADRGWLHLEARYNYEEGAVELEGGAVLHRGRIRLRCRRVGSELLLQLVGADRCADRLVPRQPGVARRVSGRPGSVLIA